MVFQTLLISWLAGCVIRKACHTSARFNPQYSILIIRYSKSGKLANPPAFFPSASPAYTFFAPVAPFFYRCDTDLKYPSLYNIYAV